MKLLRYGPAGFERPGLLDANGAIRDLSGVVEHVTSQHLAPKELAKFAKLRTEVGKNLNTRLTPTLEFILDAIPENADHISTLLREARERDADVARLASGASYAGDANPYAAEDEDDDEDEDDADADADADAGDAGEAADAR